MTAPAGTNTGAPPSPPPSGRFGAFRQRMADRADNMTPKQVKSRMITAIILVLVAAIAAWNWALGLCGVFSWLLIGAAAVLTVVGLAVAAYSLKSSLSESAIMLSIIALVLVAIPYIITWFATATVPMPNNFATAPPAATSSAAPSTTPAPTSTPAPTAKPAPSGTASSGSVNAQDAQKNPDGRTTRPTSAGPVKAQYSGGYYTAYNAKAGTNDFGPALKGHTRSEMAQRAGFKIRHDSLWAATKVYMHDTKISDPNKVNPLVIRAMAQRFEAHADEWQAAVKRVESDVDHYSVVYRSGGYSTLGMVTKNDGSMPTLVKSHETADQGWTLVTYYKNGTVLEQRGGCDLQFSKPDKKPVAAAPAKAKAKPVVKHVAATTPADKHDDKKKPCKHDHDSTVTNTNGQQEQSSSSHKHSNKHENGSGSASSSSSNSSDESHDSDGSDDATDSNQST